MNERIMISTIYAFTFIFMIYIQMIIPKISRKNIFLGIKIPEAKREDKELINIYNNYKKANIIIGVPVAIALIICTYLYTYNFKFIILAPFVLIALQFLIYLKYNKKVSELKIRENWIELAENIKIIDTKYISNKDDIQNIFRWAKLSFFILIINVIIGIYMYSRLPDIIPSHWNFQGVADGFSEKSLFSVFGIDFMMLFLIVVFYYSYYSMMKSKHEINSDNPELSIEKNKIFKNAWSSYFKFSTILMVLLFSFINLSILGIFTKTRLSAIITILVVAIMCVLSIYLTLKMGQGGQKIKLDSEEIISNKYNYEDDELWKFGNTIYYNKEDPALFVEKRIGVGWTVNAGRTAGLLIYILFIIIVVGGIIFAIMEG